jgi:hypothetical protein
MLPNVVHSRAMLYRLLTRDDTYVLNYSTKYLARDNTDDRHNYGQYAAGDPRARIAEAWRFPIIDSYYDGQDYEASYDFNAVTFIYANSDPGLTSVAAVGTFADLHAPVPLRRVAGTKYWTVTMVVPKGEVHTYKFIVGESAACYESRRQSVVSLLYAVLHANHFL